MTVSHEAIVVGAGPAGLAISRELVRAGVEHQGGLFNIARDAPRAARILTSRLRDTARTSIGTRPAPSER